MRIPFNRRTFLQTFSAGLLSNSILCKASWRDNGPQEVEITPQHFGATGDGIHDDTDCLQQAIDYASQNLISQVRIPETAGYYRLSRPLRCRSGVSIVGGPGRPRIRNTRTSYAFGLSQIFRAGNFHPSFTSKFRGIPVKPSKAGSNVLYALTTHQFEPGDDIVLQTSTRLSVATLDIPVAMELNQVNRVSGTAIVLKYPIVQAELSEAVNLHDRYEGRDGVDLFVFSNAEIRNLDLETDGFWIADSAMLNITCSNLRVRSRCGIYGNSVQRSVFSGITASYSQAAIEQGHNSLLNTYRDISLKYHGPSAPRHVICVSLQENASRLNFSNLDIEVADGLDYYPLAILNASDTTFTHSRFYGGKMAHSALYFGGKVRNSDRPCRNNSVTYSTFLFESLGAAITFECTDSPNGMSGNSVDHCNFSRLLSHQPISMKGCRPPILSANTFR